ncbi:matrixin family metalloprotease [Acinetobacter sp. ANC 4178]|uniref:matrixin family metalloprotease n=1 Tax=Acinetobacter sp. ANC 4178 TaxID=2529839 RepID=UPI00103E9CFF|nr:matrixin family metalloprotease [Acinetobacter sp. ANC 4178]TCB64403.1 matrixin family metalloprotease [Acinetobacter sp. ANC 4178]
MHRLGLILFFLAILWLSYQSHAHYQLRYNTWSDRLLHPFDQRLRFKIGNVDPWFGLTQAQVVQISQEALEIWHQGTQQTLFVYDPNAKLSIELIYDQRQQDTDALKQTQQKLDESKNQNNRSSDNIERARTQLDFTQHRLEQQEQQLEAEYRYLQSQQAQVQSAQQQQNLRDQLTQLQYRIAQFEQEAAYLEQQNQSFNQKVDQHNLDIAQFNQQILQAQQRFPAREFHKGVFMGNKIEIYQFDGNDDLRLTIAHELGHALGLTHHNDPEALMYPILGEQELQHFKLKAADLQLLAARK